MIRRGWPVFLGALVILLLTYPIYVAVGHMLGRIIMGASEWPQPARGILDRSWYILAAGVVATNAVAFVGMAVVRRLVVTGWCDVVAVWAIATGFVLLLAALSPGFDLDNLNPGVLGVYFTSSLQWLVIAGVLWLPGIIFGMALAPGPPEDPSATDTVA